MAIQENIIPKTVTLSNNPNFLGLISTDFINGDEVPLSIYNTGVFLGSGVATETGSTKLMTISKVYSNGVWFNTNSILENSNKYSTECLNSDDWCDSGTVSSLCFVQSWKTYISKVLYVITGYRRGLEENDLSVYIYDTISKNIVKPQTTQPILTHIKGQTQFFNFILSDPERNINLGTNEYNIGIRYVLSTQSGNMITEVTKHNKNRKGFFIANTIKLDIDSVISNYDNVGFVDVYLSRSDSIISEPIRFRILPECLYTLNDFAFLNSLGGWSTFNFGGTKTTEFKTTSNTISRVQTPNYNTNSQIESIYNKDVTEQFIIQTTPITLEVCEWLKELSASIAVYELSTKRYIVIDELNIKPNTKDELFILDMKYHYSDSFNSSIK